MRRMAHLFLFTALLWLQAGAAFAGDQNALLWRVEGRGAAPSYLYGTIHIDDPRVLALPAPVTGAFEVASTVVLELELDVSAALAVAQAMLFQGESGLSALVGPELYRLSVAALAERGIPEVAVERMKPWAIVMTLTVPPPRTGQPLDAMLYQQAVAKGKRTVGLETPQEQVAVFEGLTAAEQKALLRDTLAEYKSYPALFEKLTEAYLARDLDRLVEIGNETMGQSGEAYMERFMSEMIDARNLRMAQRLEPILKQGDAFIGVGALHLPGPKGLVTLLKEQGYRLTPLY